MTPPPLPPQAVPLGAPLVATAGDYGVAIAAHLLGGDGGYVYLAPTDTVTFHATEQPALPRAQRRAPRDFGGIGVPAMGDASLVSYTILAADIPCAGFYDCAFKVKSAAGATSTFPLGTLEILMSNLARGVAAILNLEKSDSTGLVSGGSPANQVIGTVVGSADLTALTYGVGGTVDGLTVIANGHTYTFVAPANAAAIVSQLVTAFTSYSPFGAGVAALSASKYLSLAGLNITGGTALTALGLAAVTFSRIYTGGVMFQNTDTTHGAWIGPAGVGGPGAQVPGFYLGPNGGIISYPAVDVGTLYVYAASGTPAVCWQGSDLA